jgi:NADPH:quinone reductase-like Zn-dependent oxidoreductase
MRAWQLTVSVTPPALRLADAPIPQAGTGQVLIRVRAAGVIATELGWYPTTHHKSGQMRANPIPSHEFAGVVEAVGPSVAGLKKGDEIYGMNDWFDEGATAEYCLTRPEWIASKPRKLSFAEAGTVPISALTAWQGLFDRANLQKGETVLVHGGSGGVGTYIVQLAKRHGARVLTTASARNRDFLLALGAERVIDYHTEQFDKVVKDIDVVFDTVGGDTLGRSCGVLKPTGRMVTIVSTFENSKDERIKKAFFIVEPKREQLVKVGAMLDSGELRVVIDAEVPFDRADAAYKGKIEGGTGRGKVVVVM